MSSRERTRRAIARTGPDRVPTYYSVLPGARAPYREALDALWAEYPPDIVLVGYAESEEFSGSAGVPAVDRWGAVWVSASDDLKGQVVVHPLPDWAALHTYVWPSPEGWPEYEGARAYLARDGRTHYVLADGDTLFQRMMYLRGVEELLVDLAMGSPHVIELRDRIVGYMLARANHWTELGVDGVYFRDDWGSQSALLIRPSLWREVFKPAYASLFQAVHAGGCHVFFHSDGMIASIVPDLLEIRVDVLHPQMSLLGASFLAEHFGGRMSFMCDPDRQHVLPYGSPGEVREHVAGFIEALAGFDGGLIGWGEVGPDVPIANVRAMAETFAGWRAPASGRPGR